MNEITDATLRTLIDETVARASERTPVPKIMPGTIIDASDLSDVEVLVDGDVISSFGQSIIGPLPTNTRVMVTFNPPSGMLIVGEIFDGSWQTPAFLNSWVNEGGVLQTTRYRREPNGIIRLEGVIQSGTIGLPAFNLPEAYRPALTHVIAVDANDAYGSVQIRFDGDVVVTVGSNARVSIDHTWALG